MLLLTGLAALAHFSPPRPITDVMVQNAADATRPVSLPDMALGPADAKVTITEYASPTCPHCADFNAKVFSEDQGGLHRYRQSALTCSASSRVTSRMPPGRAASPTATRTNISP